MEMTTHWRKILFSVLVTSKIEFATELCSGLVTIIRSTFSIDYIIFRRKMHHISQSDVEQILCTVNLKDTDNYSHSIVKIPEIAPNLSNKGTIQLISVYNTLNK